jgi:hypothetical protein
MIETSQNQIANGGLVYNRWASRIRRVVDTVDIGILGQEAINTPAQVMVTDAD